MRPIPFPQHIGMLPPVIDVARMDAAADAVGSFPHNYNTFWGASVRNFHGREGACDWCKVTRPIAGALTGSARAERTHTLKRNCLPGEAQVTSPTRAASAPRAVPSSGCLRASGVAGEDDRVLSAQLRSAAEPIVGGGGFEKPGRISAAHPREKARRRRTSCDSRVKYHYVAGKRVARRVGGVCMYEMPCARRCTARVAASATGARIRRNFRACFRGRTGNERGATLGRVASRAMIQGTCSADRTGLDRSRAFAGVKFDDVQMNRRLAVLGARASVEAVLEAGGCLSAPCVHVRAATSADGGLELASITRRTGIIREVLDGPRRSSSERN
ncbi:hypothetical protein C8R44DRAFT_862265 [Mycena epipterygia]|nr:hypothetical protein C8R44DRAFT_862265 [Mycena epipterygia]